MTALFPLHLRCSGCLVPLALLQLLAPSALGHEQTLAAYEASLSVSQRLALASSGFPSVAGAPPPAGTCALAIKLLDAETKKPLAGLVRVTLPDGHAVRLENLLNRGIGLSDDRPSWQWQALLEPTTVMVPRTNLVIEAISGLETETARQSLDLRAQSRAQVELSLKRFRNAAQEGWHNGNTHLHLLNLSRAQADEYLRQVARADGLELVFLSFVRRTNVDKDYISNSYSKEDLAHLSGDGVQFGNGEEHRNDFDDAVGYGHVMLLNLKRLIHPVSIGPGIMGEGTDWPPLRQGMEQARHDEATVIWCHNASGYEDVPDWLAGKLDALNIFDGGNRGGYEESFYRYLNVGLHVPFSTGTDWFIYDFNRVYVKTDERLTIKNWLRALTSGKTFISNGPLLDLNVGEFSVGDTVHLVQPQRLSVRARGAGRQDFRRLELIQNGAVVHQAGTHAVGGHFEAEISVAIDVQEPSWIALRVGCNEKHQAVPGLQHVVTGPDLYWGGVTNRTELGEALFAHTSPIYIELGGRGVFKPDSARELIEDIEESVSIIQKQGHFAEQRQLYDILGIYYDGVQSLRRRLQE